MFGVNWGKLVLELGQRSAYGARELAEACDRGLLPKSLAWHPGSSTLGSNGVRALEGRIAVVLDRQV